MWLRFFWTGLRENVKNWVKSCANCIYYNVWSNRKQEIHFSWPVTISFCIMHADIWSPWNALHGNKAGCQLLNTMYNLAKFAISSIITSTMSELLATLFMEEVVLSYVMIAILVVDADSQFKGTFEDMCRILCITYWQLSRGNHKVNSIEKYHNFKIKHKPS